MQIFAKLLYQDYSAQYVIIVRSILLFLVNSWIMVRSPQYRGYPGGEAGEKRELGERGGSKEEQERSKETY